MEPAARLDAGLVRLGLDVPDTVRGRLLDYLALLARWNRAFNLTAVRDPDAMVTRHLLDSLTVLPFVRGTRLLDVGTGAGLPGMVVAIARPELAVTLLDANGKKTRFCRQAAAELSLERVTVVQDRVETYTPDAPFDTVVSRAFRDPDAFLRSCENLAAAGSRLVAMAGRVNTAVVPAAAAVHALSVPGLEGVRHVVVLETGGARASAD